MTKMPKKTQKIFDTTSAIPQRTDIQPFCAINQLNRRRVSITKKY